MNGPQHDLDKRRSERERTTALAAEFQKCDPQMLEAARGMLEELLNARFYTAKGIAMATQQPVAKITFEVLFNFAPGQSKAVEVRDNVTCPPVTDILRRVIEVGGKE